MFGGTGWSSCVVLRACKMGWITFDEVEVLYVVYDYSHHPLVIYP